MTQTPDLDRLLDDWLTDGPNRAPDQPITAASQFARAHPRRPDPLRFLRSDPMADRRRPFGLQPGLVFALLALVAAIVAAGVIGSRLERPPVVVPHSDQLSPSSPRDGSPPASPSTPPSSSPLFTVDLATTAGRPATVDVVDLSGLVVSGVSGPAIEGATVEGIVVTNDKADSLLITWAGTPCDTVHRLTVDATATHILLERPRCQNDSIARDRSLVLKFSRSIVASDVEATIVDGDGAGGELPNWTVSGPDTAGNGFHVSIFDGSGKLTAVESSSQGGDGATLPPNTGRVENVAPDTIKLTWARGSCETEERLDIDPDVKTMTLTGTGCGTGTGVFDREVLLTFSSAVNVADLTFNVVAAPGPS
jgi:hypothetical protein